MNTPQQIEPGGKEKFVRASDLAQMAICEQAWLLERSLGRRRTKQQQVALQRGQKMHQNYFREGLILMDQSREGWLSHLLKFISSWLTPAWSRKKSIGNALPFFNTGERRGRYE